MTQISSAEAKVKRLETHGWPLTAFPWMQNRNADINLLQKIPGEEEHIFRQMTNMV
jgi:hypothetical protein